MRNRNLVHIQTGQTRRLGNLLLDTGRDTRTHSRKRVAISRPLALRGSEPVWVKAHRDHLCRHSWGLWGKADSQAHCSLRQGSCPFENHCPGGRGGWCLLGRTGWESLGAWQRYECLAGEGVGVSDGTPRSPPTGPTAFLTAGWVSARQSSSSKMSSGRSPRWAQRRDMRTEWCRSSCRTVGHLDEDLLSPLFSGISAFPCAHPPLQQGTLLLQR